LIGVVRTALGVSWGVLTRESSILKDIGGVLFTFAAAEVATIKAAAAAVATTALAAYLRSRNLKSCKLDELTYHEESANPEVNNSGIANKSNFCWPPNTWDHAHRQLQT
jgi:hypothetical protein